MSYIVGTKHNLGKLSNTITPNRSDVFIFYAGHGAPGLRDKKGYFVLVDADPSCVELGGYPLEVFQENMAKLSAKFITVVLDSCFSGANIYENISPVIYEDKSLAAGLKNGVALSSSMGNQVARGYNEKKHGMFTYILFKRDTQQKCLHK